jgi:hypothetical protein
MLWDLHSVPAQSMVPYPLQLCCRNSTETRNLAILYPICELSWLFAQEYSFDL